jgi:hypothetical protein
VLFMKTGNLYYNKLHRRIGVKIVSKDKVPTGKVALGAAFTKSRENPKFVANGTLKLYATDKVIGEGTIHSQPGMYADDGSVVGRETSDPVSFEYKSPFPFKGGTIKQIVVNLTGKHVVDIECEAHMMLGEILADGLGFWPLFG